MNKLVSNTLIFAIGSFSSRILVFFLVPLYSRTLSTSEYGKIDLITTLISLILPVFTLTIHEAIIRFCLEKNTDKSQILSIGLQTIFIGMIPLLIIMPPLLKFLNLENLIWYFLAAYIFTALKQVFSFFARGTEKIRLVVIMGIIDTVLTIVLNLIFLLYLDKGINGYYYSLIITGLLISVIYYIVLDIKPNTLFKRSNIILKKEMLLYSLPMIPNSLSWWISNSSDKILINYFYGASLTGLYAIAYKIPSLLNTITSIFMQAWQISAVEEFESQENDNFSNAYTFLFGINILVCVLLIIFSKTIARIMFSSEFYLAVNFVPILLVAYFFNGMSAYLGSIYTSSKKTNMLFISTMFGAVINIILNLILIPNYGGYGAAIATSVSYMVIWIVRLINTRKILKLNFNILNHIFDIISLLGIAFVFYFDNNITSLFFKIVFIMLVINNNKFIFKNLYEFLFSAFQKRYIK